MVVTKKTKQRKAPTKKRTVTKFSRKGKKTPLSKSRVKTRTKSRTRTHTKTRSKSPRKSPISEKKECAICFESLDGDLAGCKKCFNEYHKECAKKWCVNPRSNKACPMCRDKAFSDMFAELETMRETSTRPVRARNSTQYHEQRLANAFLRQ